MSCWYLKRWIALAAGIVALIAIVVVAADGRSADAAEVESPFDDDNWSTHEANINALGDAGITRGCNPPANDHFCPNLAVTRGQMAAFLVRAFGYTERGTKTFIDDNDSIFEADIEKLAAAGVTSGCNPPANTRFCPDMAVTRAQMASLLVRALDLTPLPDGPFVDTAGTVHSGAINAIADARITLGCDPPANTRFCPQDPVTRAQMATFLVRALDLEPVYNEISLFPGSSCSRDQEVCTARLTMPEGQSFNIREGWRHAVPFASGEEDVFRSAGTRFDLTLDGRLLGTQRIETATAELAEREWIAFVDDLAAGAHTLRGTWRWDGAVNLTVVLTLDAG